MNIFDRQYKAGMVANPCLQILPWMKLEVMLQVKGPVSTIWRSIGLSLNLLLALNLQK